MLSGEGEGLFKRALLGNEDLGRRKDVVGEEEVCEIAELAEGFDTSLHERCDLAKIVVTEDRGTQRRVEVLGRERAKILAVEPLQLREVKDRTAEANVFEVEAFDHLSESEFFGDRPVPSGMPPPIRPRKLIMASGRKPACR